MSLGGMLTAFQGDPGFRTLNNVKSKPIQKGIDSLLSDWNAGRTSGSTALKDYIAKYMAGEPAAETRTGQETGWLDSLYNGGMSNTLAGLRSRREAAVNNAADVATGEALRAVSLNRLGSQGGGGSYDRRIALSALAPIRTQAAVDTLDQERNDLGYLTGLQSANTGRRQAMADALAQYGLAPEQLRRGMLSQDIQSLSGIESANNANNFYGLQRKTTGMDRWGNFADNLMGTAGDVMGLAGAYQGLTKAGGGTGSL